jgi:hypothetical protein
MKNVDRRATRRWRDHLRLPLAVAFTLAVAACGVFPPDDPVEPVEPEVNTRFDLVTVQPVAAGEVVIDHPGGVSFGSAVSLRNGQIVRAASTGTTTRIAWVASAASSGSQVRVSFDVPDGAPAPSLADSKAFAGAGSGGGTAVMMQAAVGTAPTVAPPAPAALVHPDDARLEASFAEHPLGDVDGDGTVDVHDALLAFATAVGSAADDFRLYHSDLDNDGVTDLGDVGFVLDKVVDRQLPAVLHVKPRSLSFVELDPDADGPGIVLIGNRGNLPLPPLAWHVPAAGIDAPEVAGIPGQSAAVAVAVARPRPHGWLPDTFRITSGDASAQVRLGNLVLLIAGQSNASGRGQPILDDPVHPSVRMLHNDYRWRPAQEPLDDPTGQVDPRPDLNARYSFGTRLGTLLHDAFGYPTYLIPAAVGGSHVTEWLPTSPLETSTLFGSANVRAHVSAGGQPNPVASQPYPHEGGPVNVVVWYQGESDEPSARREAFVRRTNQVFDAFLSEHGAPTVYVQLASEYDAGLNVRYHAVAELQRRMETGSGEPESRQRAFMVVAHDLPRSDSRHLSAYGQRVLAERIALAVREHVFGEDVDGTGPRLVAVHHEGDRVFVRTDRALGSEALDIRRFTVFDGPPDGSVDDVASYGGNTIDIVSAVRDPGDPTAVLLTLSGIPADAPHVRYMAPPNLLPSAQPNGSTGDASPGVWETVASGVVRDAASALPLPAFGPRGATPHP